MSEVVVSLQEVVKQYQGADSPAVNKLQFDITKGSVFGLLGPNGAGKSTTVMMLCGLIKPSHGKISVLGMDPVNEGEDIRKYIGVAPQEIALFPSLTANENLFYFGRMYGLPSAVIKSQVEKHLEIFGLSSKAKSRVDTFSGGMKRRLNLIAALLHNPQLIILDEPTAGVDVQSRNMILDFLMDLKSHGVTIIYSSHLLDEAERICTHVSIIDDGKIVLTGDLPTMMKNHSTGQSLEHLFLELTGKNIRD